MSDLNKYDRWINKTKALAFDMFSLAYLFIATIWIYEFSYLSASVARVGRLFLAGGTGAFFGVCWFWSGRSAGIEIMNLIEERTSDCSRKWRIVFYFAITMVTFIVGVLVTKFSVSALFDSDGLQGIGRIFSALFHPQISILNRALIAMTETIYIAFMSTILAIPPAFMLSFLGSKNIMAINKSGRFVYMTVRGTINFLRSVEPLIWAIIFSIWVGIGPFAGMMALMVNSIAGLIKLYSEQIESIDDGVIMALQSTGASPLHVLWFGIVPQITLPFLAFSIYRWDVNVRMATVIGLVGGGGIGTLLMQYQGLAKWNEVGLIILMISLVVWGMDFLSVKIRERVL